MLALLTVAFLGAHVVCFHPRKKNFFDKEGARVILHTFNNLVLLSVDLHIYLSEGKDQVNHCPHIMHTFSDLA